MLNSNLIASFSEAIWTFYAVLQFISSFTKSFFCANLDCGQLNIQLKAPLKFLLAHRTQQIMTIVIKQFDIIVKLFSLMLQNSCTQTIRVCVDPYQNAVIQ